MDRPPYHFLLAFCVIAIALTPGVARAQDSSNSPKTHLNQLIAQAWEYQMRTHPEQATANGDNRFNDRLTDHSPAAFDREMKHDAELVAQLQKIGLAGLGSEDQLNRQLLLRTVQTRLEGMRLKDWEMPVDQMNGPHLEYAGMSDEMPFKTVRDYENYLSRLRGLPQALA